MQYPHTLAKKCSRCGYRHPRNSVITASGIGHFTSLCNRPRTADTPWTATDRAGPSREYPIAAGTAAIHPAEANNHTEAQVKVLLTHATSTGIGEAPHHTDMRLATFSYHYHTLTGWKADC